MIITTSNLQKIYGRHDALRGLNIAVPEGACYALIGANGAGKTTTIKMLMNILTPTKGSASVFGVNSRKLSPREFANIGYVSENQDMPARLSVGEFLNYLRPFYPTWDRTLEREVLAKLRLPLDRKIRDLSHGVRRKMALASALPFRPQLLVLDEPFSGLDTLIREEFMEQLLGQAGEMTVFISSHELNEIESFTTHVGFIDAGTLLFEESMDDLSQRSRAVRLTFEKTAVLPLPAQVPRSWIQLTTSGNMLSYVDTQFSETNFAQQLATYFTGIRHVEAQPMALRNIFTAMARANQQQELSA
jgi:ABC-2 type transport system ATP-binding protein